MGWCIDAVLICRRDIRMYLAHATVGRDQTVLLLRQLEGRRRQACRRWIVRHSFGEEEEDQSSLARGVLLRPRRECRTLYRRPLHTARCQQGRCDEVRYRPVERQAGHYTR